MAYSGKSAKSIDSNSVAEAHENLRLLYMEVGLAKDCCQNGVVSLWQEGNLGENPLSFFITHVSSHSSHLKYKTNKDKKYRLTSYHDSMNKLVTTRNME